MQIDKQQQTPKMMFIHDKKKSFARLMKKMYFQNEIIMANDCCSWLSISLLGPLFGSKFSKNSTFSISFQLTLLKYLPLRTISRVWGLMTSLYLPICLRSSVLGSYSRLFDCQLKEAEIDDYRLYPSLKQFFTRSLKPGLRPIAPGDNLVSIT